MQTVGGLSAGEEGDAGRTGERGSITIPATPYDGKRQRRRRGEE